MIDKISTGTDPKLHAKESIAKLRTQLSSIVSKNVTSENIDTFADSAMSDLISLVDEVTKRYKLEHRRDSALGKDLEDKAFSEYDLGDIHSYLSLVQEKSDQIKRVDEMLGRTRFIPEVITPPDKSDSIPKGNRHPFEVASLVPRLKLLIYILDNDFNIEPDDINLTRGIVTDKMVRRESYVTAEINTLHRIVQVCDEAGNASYVFDSDIMRIAGVTVNQLNKFGKDEKASLMKKFDGIGTRLTQNPHWRDAMSELLSSPLKGESERQAVVNRLENLPSVITSEFDPWRGFILRGATHWGSIPGISRIINVSRDVIHGYLIQHPDITSFEAKSVVGSKVNLYPLESLKTMFEGYSSIPRVDLEGEWRGFVSIDGMRWGSTLSISKRLGLGLGSVLKAVKDNPQLATKRMRAVTGVEADAYSVEQIGVLFKDFLSLPKVADEGEWRGFVEADGMHWGGVSTICKKTNLFSSSAIYTYLEHNKDTPIIRGRNLMGNAITLYPIERILDGMQEYLSLPQVNLDGEWAGFHERDGSHWGSTNGIIKRLGLSANLYKELKGRKDVPTMKIRDRASNQINAYSLEQIQELFGNNNNDRK